MMVHIYSVKVSIGSVERVIEASGPSIIETVLWTADAKTFNNKLGLYEWTPMILTIKNKDSGFITKLVI